MFSYRKNQNEHQGKGKEKSTLFILFFAIFLFINPFFVNAQTTQISLSVQNATLKQFFDTIEKQTSYTFTYRDIVVEGKGDITLNITNQAVQQILNTVLPSRDLQYTITGNSIQVNKVIKLLFVMSRELSPIPMENL